MISKDFTFETNALIEIPCFEIIWLAIEPATTLTAVSLAEDLPPPLWSLKPYFFSYTKSAWDGR